MELKSRLPGTGIKICRELDKWRVMYGVSKKILTKYSNIYQWYFVNIFLEMSYIILYLAYFWFQSQLAGTMFCRVRRTLRLGMVGTTRLTINYSSLPGSVSNTTFINWHWRYNILTTSCIRILIRPIHSTYENEKIFLLPFTRIESIYVLILINEKICLPTSFYTYWKYICTNTNFMHGWFLWLWCSFYILFLIILFFSNFG